MTKTDEELLKEPCACGHPFGDHTDEGCMHPLGLASEGGGDDGKDIYCYCELTHGDLILKFMSLARAAGEQKGREDAMTYKCVFCHELGGAIGKQMIHAKCVNPKIAQLEQQVGNSVKEKMEINAKYQEVDTERRKLEQQLKIAKQEEREKIKKAGYWPEGEGINQVDYVIEKHEFPHLYGCEGTMCYCGARAKRNGYAYKEGKWVKI